MFGISFAELLVIIIIALIFIGPKDMPEIARYIIKMIIKIKKFIQSATAELKEVSKELGLDDIKSEVEREIIAQKIKLEKDVTTIIDIYGNEHQVPKIEELRPDMNKEELQEEINKYNEINSSSKTIKDTDNKSSDNSN